MAVIVRDSYGCLCGAIAMRATSLFSVLATELYALKICISFAVDASFTPIIIESDSLTVIQLLLQDDPCYTAEGPLVDDIKRLIALFSSYSARFVPRTANGVADHLARFSLGQEDLAFWLSNPPLWLQDCLLADSPICYDV
ncbi:hypothetical protein CerSpe_245520 [Prunus speciosa]